MNYKIIKGKEVQEKDFGLIKVKELLNESSFNEFSLAKVSLDGVNNLGFNKGSNLIYYILSGSGEFEIDGTNFVVEAGDAILIPKNTKYRDKGKMTLLSLSSPRFEASNYQVVEE